MKVALRFIVLLGATAMMALSVVWLNQVDGFWSWASALCAMWFVVVWISSLHLLIRLQLPEWYFQAKGFEESTRVYELFGVLLIRQLVRRGPLHILAPEYHYSGRRESIPRLLLEARIAETIHVIALLGSFMLVAYALFMGRLVAAGWLLVFNVLINIYPVMLQRYNRLRLQRLLTRMAQSR
jgi:hypothetical protein